MDETNWQRQVLVGLLALAVVAVLVGVIGGVLSLQAAELAGIGSKTDDTTPTEGVTTSTTSQAPQATETAPPPRPDPPPSSTKPAPSAIPPSRPIVLKATPRSTAAYERVDLTGTYQGDAAATSLQVQRLEGEIWVDFPVSASVTGGTFSTYIRTGVVGVNRFRMQADSGQTSNVVTVTIT